MKRRSTILHFGIAPILGNAALTAAMAATYYVSVDGKADTDWAKNKPYTSVEAALAKVGGGHTIIVTPGVYRGLIQIAKRFAGTKEAPTT